MKISCLIVALTCILSALAPMALSAQETKPIDVLELAEKEADRLQELLDLDDWQVFYVDSTLKHDYSAMRKEMDSFQKSKVSNSSMYISVQDKWMEATDDSYKKIFTQEQWNTYLKSGAAKQRKAREKRRLKAQAALEK